MSPLGNIEAGLIDATLRIGCDRQRVFGDGKGTGMEMEGHVIKSTAGEIAAELRQRGVDPADPVTVLVGRPSLSVVARRLQTEAADRGMTNEIHDELMSGLKKPR